MVKLRRAELEAKKTNCKDNDSSPNQNNSSNSTANGSRRLSSNNKKDKWFSKNVLLTLLLYFIFSTLINKQKWNHNQNMKFIWLI